MSNTILIKKVEQILRQRFKKFSEITSVYLYGSILSNEFSDKSDIDVLFIVSDLLDTGTFLSKVKSIRALIEKHNLDINVVFMKEFVRRWHIYRPPTYFFWIKNRGRLLWGRDIIKSIRKSDITPEMIYKRAVDLSQSCRSVYINNKDGTFWEPKYRRWLRTLVSGIYFLESGLEFDFEICIKKLSEKHSELVGIPGLSFKKTSIKSLSEISESLSTYMYNKYIAKK